MIKQSLFSRVMTFFGFKEHNNPVEAAAADANIHKASKHQNINILAYLKPNHHLNKISANNVRHQSAKNLNNLKFFTVGRRRNDNIRRK